MNAFNNHRPLVPRAGPVTRALDDRDFLDTVPVECFAFPRESPSPDAGSPSPIDLALARFDEASSALAMSAQAIQAPALAPLRAVAAPLQPRAAPLPVAGATAPASRRLLGTDPERTSQIGRTRAGAEASPIVRAGFERRAEIAQTTSGERHAANPSAKSPRQPLAASGRLGPTAAGPRRRVAMSIAVGVVIASVLLWARHASTRNPLQSLDGMSQPETPARRASMTDGEAAIATELLERAPTAGAVVASPAPAVTIPMPPRISVPRLTGASARARMSETPRTPPQTVSIAAAVAAAQSKADRFLGVAPVEPEAASAPAGR